MASSRKNQQPDLAARASETLASLLSQARPLRLCVALSGGLDSVVLLHLLAQQRQALGIELTALHVHHGLSPNADDWAQFVLALTRELSVPCRIERVQVDLQGDGLEAAARAARYAVFSRADADVLALAHHGNDQAETVLFNLLRGGGVSGLAGMPRSRLHEQKILIRPLLNEPRAELEAYARAHALSWVEDESNASLAFSRNHLRHEILPALASRYPAVVQTLVRTARHLSEADELLVELANMDLAICVHKGVFDLDRARTLSPARMRHALRHWLHEAGIVLESRTWDEMLDAMLSARDDRLPALVWRQHAVRRYRHHLYITSAQCRAGESLQIVPGGAGDWPLAGWSGVLRLEAGGVLSPCCLGQPWRIRPWRGSEMMRLAPGRHRRSLKHLCQEAGIPPWVRESTPLIYLGERLMAVPGLGVDADFQVSPGENGLGLVWSLMHRIL